MRPTERDLETFQDWFNNMPPGDRLLFQGREFNDAGNYQRAIEVYDRVLAFNISTWDKHALEGKGIALLGLKRHEEAIEYFDKSIATHCMLIWTASAHNNKGLPLFELGRYHDAIEEYDKAVAA
jgi:tetratricopeptide (TPR) repeat protein